MCGLLPCLVGRVVHHTLQCPPHVYLGEEVLQDGHTAPLAVVRLQGVGLVSGHQVQIFLLTCIM